MRKEEAIQILNRLSRKYPGEANDSAYLVGEALTMAIRSLNQEPCENCRTVGHSNKARWIPVGERLPKKEGHYLITADFGKYGFLTSVRWWHGEKVTWETEAGRVIAWMPMPDPYKEET